MPSQLCLSLFCILLLFISGYKLQKQGKQKNCVLSQWSQWTACDRFCGNSGTQTRRRTRQGHCQADTLETKACNRFCRNDGIPANQGCVCSKPFSGRCCEHENGNKNGKDCEVSEWSAWSVCSAQCGNQGIQRRSRVKLVPETGDGKCPFDMDEQQACNRICRNGGTPLENSCACKPGFTGTCCEFGGTNPTPVVPPDGSDPCVSHVSKDNYQRSTSYIVPAGSSSYMCDRTGWSTTWYRFTSKAGGMMPTKCPPKNACGSRGSVWLDGTHPTTVGEEKTLNAKVRVGEKCDTANAWSVKVKKCSKNGEEFFVYYLRPTVGCPMSYCAGKETKCEPGESSPTGFTPGCSSKFPKHHKDPVVSVGVKDNRMQFTCKIYPKDTGENAWHRITWYQGPPEKRIEKTDTLSGTQTEAYLRNNNKYGDKPMFCLGQTVYCKVESYFAKTPNLKSRPRKSNEFFAGFKIEPKVLDLSEKDKPKTVRVTTTVPLICQDGTENCEVLVELGQTNTDNFVDFCTLKFKPGPSGQTREVEVVAKRDFIDDGDQTMFLKIHIPDHIDPVDWNCYKNITDVKIKTKDVKTSRCTSTGDPHVRTFDGLYYNHFEVGDYVLVKSGARMFEVHVRTYRCRSVSCNCAIAVREGDDVIVVDMCRDNIPRARFASTVEPQKGTTIERNNNGKSFVLNFPSGAFVRFDSQRWFGRWYYANLIVQLPSDDYKNTTGLCGTYDKDRGNDMKARNGQIHNGRRGRTAPRQFTESWKVGSSESLFYYKGGPKKCLADRAKSYCTCRETCCGKRNINCDFEGYTQRPKYLQGFRGWKKLEFPGAEFCGKRRRRAIDDDVVVLPDDGETGVYEYNPPNIPVDEKTFPTKTGKQEYQAKSHCTKTIQESTIGKACIKTIVGFDLTDYVDQCVFDVKVWDNYQIATDSAINTLAGACEEETLRDVKKYWKKDTTGLLAPPVEIGDSACPNECNGRGKCQNATCICDDGYITADCSMKKGQSPVLLGVPFNGLCDIRKQDCVRTRVMGYDFIDSAKLRCRMKEVITGEKPYVETSRHNTDFGQLLSFGEISCLLPYRPVAINGDPFTSRGKPTGGFLISVSNDGQNFSKNKTLMLIYDSKCMDCSLDNYKRCVWKPNSCKINEYCYAPNDPNPRDWCQVCDPTKSNTSFVKRTNNQPPKFNGKTKLYTFKGQTWRFSIPAVDPERQSLKYTFIGNNHGMLVSSVGKLTWYPTKNGTYEFTVKVTDPCGLSAQQTFSVEVSSCVCEGQNGGYCVWKGDPATTGVGICKCPSGCTGNGCTTPIVGRICNIGQTGKRQDDSSSSSGIIALVVIIIIILIIVAVLGFMVYWLKSHKQPVNGKSMKDLTLRAAGTMYNAAHRKKDQKVQMKFGGLESTGAVNEGYQPS